MILGIDPLIIETLVFLLLLGGYTLVMVVLSRRVENILVFYTLSQVAGLLSFVVITAILFLVFQYVTHPSEAWEMIIFWLVMGGYMGIVPGIIVGRKATRQLIRMSQLESRYSWVLPVVSGIVVVGLSVLLRTYLGDVWWALGFVTLAISFLLVCAVVAMVRKLPKQQALDFSGQTLGVSILFSLLYSISTRIF